MENVGKVIDDPFNMAVTLSSDVYNKTKTYYLSKIYNE
jgi:hypothetical protein